MGEALGDNEFLILGCCAPNDFQAVAVRAECSRNLHRAFGHGCSSVAIELEGDFIVDRLRDKVAMSGYSGGDHAVQFGGRSISPGRTVWRSGGGAGLARPTTSPSSSATPMPASELTRARSVVFQSPSLPPSPETAQQRRTAHPITGTAISFPPVPRRVRAVRALTIRPEIPRRPAAQSLTECGSADRLRHRHSSVATGQFVGCGGIP